MMNIRPLYDRIVVKRVEEQETQRNGIVIPDSAKEKPQEGEVMAVGNGKRLDSGQMVALDVKVGARILFGKYSGNEITSFCCVLLKACRVDSFCQWQKCAGQVHLPFEAKRICLERVNLVSHLLKL